MSGYIDSPFSLEDMCFLCVISWIEDFSDKILFLLPFKIRLGLMRRLSAVDLENLQLSLGNGIDRESIWESLFNCFYPYFATMHDTGTKNVAGFFRRTLLDEAADQALEPYSYNEDSSVPLWASTTCYNDAHLASALESLLCLPMFGTITQHSPSSISNSLKLYGYSVLCFGCGRIYLNRSAPKTIESPWKDYTLQRLAIAEVLSRSFNHHPEMVQYYYHSKCILEFHRSSEVVREFLAGSKRLSLGCYDQHIEYKQPTSDHKKTQEHNPQHILHTILKYPEQCSLEVVSVFSPGLTSQFFSEFTAMQVKLIVPFFASGFAANMIDCIPTIIPLPYSRLRKIEVVGLVEMDSSDDGTNQSAVYCLAEILKHQKCLESLTVKGCFGSSQNCENLIMAINSLLLTPYFKELHVDTKENPMLLSKKELCRLFITLFLSSSVEKFEMAGIKCSQNVEGVPSKWFTHSPNRRVKVVILRSIEIPADVMTALSSVAATFQLEELMLEEVVLPNGMLIHITANTIVVIGSLIYSNLKPVNLGDFIKPFLNSCLEKICFRGTKQIMDTAQLSKMSSSLKSCAHAIENFKEIAIIDCNLGIPEENFHALKEFYMALLTIAKHVDLEVNVRDSTLGEAHLLLLHKIWKKNFRSSKFFVFRLSVLSTVLNVSGLKSKLNEMSDTLHTLNY